MAIGIQADGVEFKYSANAKLEGKSWKDEYKNLSPHTRYLINRTTGEILPNSRELRHRSDALDNIDDNDPRVVEMLEKARARAEAETAGADEPTAGDKSRKQTGAKKSKATKASNDETGEMPAL